MCARGLVESSGNLLVSRGDRTCHSHGPSCKIIKRTGPGRDGTCTDVRLSWDLSQENTVDGNRQLLELIVIFVAESRKG